MAQFDYTWDVYGKRSVKDLKDYLPEYRLQNIARPTSTYTPTEYSDRRGAYASDISRALADLNKVKSSKPGAYNSEYNERINALIDQISGRKFQYDAANDAAYKLMRDNYVNLGKQAAADTAGQAAALTGGYGSSYGTVAANQAYQGYLEKLNDRIPELQQQALQLYQQEGSDLNNQYAMLSDREAQAYNKYRDSLADWQNERAYYDAALNNLRSMNQGVWGQNEQNRYNALAQAWNNYWQGDAADRASRQWAYDTARNLRNDDVSYNQWADQMTETSKQNAWQRGFSEAQAQDSYQQYQDNLALQYAQMRQSAAQHKAEMKYKRDALKANTQPTTTLPDGSTPLGSSGNSHTAAVVKKINQGELSVSRLNDYLEKMYNTNQLSYREVYWLKEVYGI